jgi:hypothetical protein
MAIGVSGEMAELLNAALNKDEVNLLEEMGDIEFYVEGLFQGLGVIAPTPIPVELGSRLGSMSCLVIIAGELLDFAKRFAIYQKPLEKIAFLKTLKEFRSELDGVYPVWNITHEQAIAGNIAKLGKRYEGLQYSDKAATERKDKDDE